MEPSGLNIKEKFRTFINKGRLGSNSEVPGTPGHVASSSVTYSQDLLANDLNRRCARTSAASTNRGRIQGPLTDFEEEEVLKGVEDLYFTDDFDPTPHEIAKFPPNFDQAAVDVQRQRLLRQLKVVTKRAFMQILEKRSECNIEFENVRLLEAEVAKALHSVSKGRNGLYEARTKFTASSLGILAAYRRRQRARALLDNLTVISTLQRTDEKLHQCLEDGEYSGAIHLLLEAQNAAKTYSHFKSIEQLSHKLKETLELAEEQLDVALSKICVDFKEPVYARLQEAYKLLGKTQTSMDQLQMHSASAVHNTAWNVVYGHVVLCHNNAEDVEISKKLYGDLCSQLALSSLLPCLVDLCRSLCGIMRSYLQIFNWHKMQASGEIDQDFVIKKLTNGFQRIWQDVQTKVRILISSNSVTGLNIDAFLKIIDTIHILIEVGWKFSGSDSGSLQQSLKEQCLSYFNAYHSERLNELKMHLDNEGWALCPVKHSFKVIQLKEFRHMAASLPGNSSLLISTKSPRKSFREIIEAARDDFVAPFDNFLDETVMEENFMLEEAAFYPEEEISEDDEEDLPAELTQEFIDEGDGVIHSTPKKGLVAIKKSAEIPILTNTSLMLLRLCGKYLHLMQMLEPISCHVFTALTQLLDFYCLTVYDFFASSSDMNEIHMPVIKPRFQTVIARFRKIFDNNLSSGQRHTNGFKAPETSALADHVLDTLRDSESLHGLAQKITAVESVIFVARQFIFLRPFMTTNDNASVNIYYAETIEVIEDLRLPVYLTSCSKAINSEVALQLMSKVAWDIRDVKSQHSQYVDVLLRELQIFSMRLQDLSDSIVITNEVVTCLWSLCTYASAAIFVEGFSQAKKCSNEGRALMQLDFRHFVMKLERISEIKPLPHQDYVTNYVKAFYIPEAELEEWMNQHPEYSSKQLIALINSVAYSNNKTKQKLNQMVNDFSEKIRRQQ